MSNLEVRIVRLEPMRVAVAHGFGKSPEAEAWDKILAFARSKGLLNGKTPARFFGHNNPDPSPGSENYGYDQWITVGAEVTPTEGIEIRDFTGGLYAVTRCKLPVITDTWHRLVTWAEDSPHTPLHQQWLEEAITPPGTPYDEMVLDLYLPVRE